jgi:omega-amidase
MRAHLVQFDIAWEDPTENFSRVRTLLRAAKPARGDLVVLPEMFDTGFSMNTARTADRGETLAFLAGLADELGVLVQGGRTVMGPEGARNEMVTLAPGSAEPIARYAKIHLFSLGGEQQAIAHGQDLDYYDWPAEGGSLRVCPTICYDLRFPELFRRGLLGGAELFALGACWLEARHAHWPALLLARAIENQAFVLGVNRVGTDPNARYLGGSIAIDPRGTILGQLGDQPGVLSVEIDPSVVRASRKSFPAWKDHRLLRP